MNEFTLFDSLFNNLIDVSSNVIPYAADPRVDLKEEDKSYTMEMELPGHTENDIDIELDHDNLTIASKTKESKEEKEDCKAPKYLLKERRCRAFQRRFTLPDDVDSEAITANFKNGILTINMAKKAVSTPKRIEIKAG